MTKTIDSQQTFPVSRLSRKIPFLFLIALIFHFKPSNGQTFTVLAGNGSSSATVTDGTAATSSPLSGPQFLTNDKNGTTYFIDKNCIRKIDSSGRLYTVAGGGNITSLPTDTVNAVGATLGTPQSMAIDTSGNIYIADLNFNAIRKITTTGKIYTICGTGAAGNGADTGLARNVVLNSPFGVALDKRGNVYFTDRNNNKVRMIDSAGRIYTIRMSSDSFNHPSGIIIDEHSNVYVSDFDNRRVCKLDSGTTNFAVYKNFSSLWSASTRVNYINFDNKGNLYLSYLNKKTIGVYKSSINSLFDNLLLENTATNLIPYVDTNGTVQYKYTDRFSYQLKSAARRFDTISVISLDSFTTAGYYYTGYLGRSTRKHCMTENQTFTAVYATYDSAVKFKWKINRRDLASVGVNDSGTTFVYNNFHNYDTVTCDMILKFNNRILKSSKYVVWCSNDSTIPTISGDISVERDTICIGESMSNKLNINDTGGHWNYVDFYYWHDYTYSSDFSRRLSTGYKIGTSTKDSTLLKWGLYSDNNYWRGRDSITHGTIIYYKTNTCGTNTKTYTITELPQPTVVVTGPSVVCPGTPTTINKSVSNVLEGYYQGKWLSLINNNYFNYEYGSTYGSYTTMPVYSSIDINSGVLTSDTRDTIVGATYLVKSIYGCVLKSQTSPIMVGTKANTWGGNPYMDESAPNTVCVGNSIQLLNFNVRSDLFSYATNYTSDDEATRIFAGNYWFSPHWIPFEYDGRAATRDTSMGIDRWSSSNTAVATVSNSGLVRGVSTGTTQIKHIYSNSCGIDSTVRTITVQTFSLPSTVAPITGPNAVCAGSTTTFADTSTGGVWQYNYPQNREHPYPWAHNYENLRNAGGGTFRVVDTPYYNGYGHSFYNYIFSDSATIFYTKFNACGFRTRSKLVEIDWHLANATFGYDRGNVVTSASSLCPGAALTCSIDYSYYDIWGSLGGRTVINHTSTEAYLSGAGILSRYSASRTTSSDVLSLTLTTPGCGTDHSSHYTSITFPGAPDAGTISGSSYICGNGSTSTYTSSRPNGEWSNSNADGLLNTHGSSTDLVENKSGTDILNYKVTENACGLTASTYMNIYIERNLNGRSLSPGGVSLNPGGTQTFTDPTGFTGGSWSVGSTTIASNSGGLVTAISPGTTQILHSGSNSCGSFSVVGNVRVQCPSLYATAPRSASSYISLGATQTISVSGTTGGDWYDPYGKVTFSGTSGDGLSTTMTGVATGTTRVYYIVSDVCGNTYFRYKTINVTATRGVETIPSESDAQASVYPNPTTGNLNLLYSNFELGMLKYKIVDVTGRVLIENQIEVTENEGSSLIDCNKLNTGLYMLVLQSGSEIRQIKFEVAK